MNQAAYETKIASYTWQGVEIIQFNKFPLLEKYAYIQFIERFDETRSISKNQGLRYSASLETSSNRFAAPVRHPKGSAQLDRCAKRAHRIVRTESAEFR
jgi:hypothetical protein